MAQDTTPALVLYVGDGTQTRFEVPFDKGAYGEIKVAFVRRGLTDYTYNPDTYTVSGYLYAWNGGVYTKTETVDTDTPLYDKYGDTTGDTWTEGMYREPKNDIFTQATVEWTGDTLTSSDVICITRDTVKDQPYEYPNNQKHIERALDNLARQIQELQLTADNALKVDPSWNYTLNDTNKMDPITWLQTIVRSKGQTLRELRIDNGYVAYTSDDPDSASKTWNVLAGVKTGNAGVVSHIRETKVLAEDGVSYIPYLEYSTDGGESWKPAGQAASALEYQYVKKSGDTMTGPLVMRDYLEFQQTEGGTALYLQQRLNSTLMFAQGLVNNHIEMTLGQIDVSIHPWLTGVGTLGKSTARWANAYVAKINNGGDLIVPSVEGTLATKADVDLAANSGVMITPQGFWYAKMDSGTTAPAATYGTNYVDFSQTDNEDNPIIVPFDATGSATASQTTGSSLSDVAVTVATFEEQITTAGSYAFEYDGADWSYDGNTVDLTDYGITYTGTPVTDDVITVVYSIAWVQGQTITPPAAADGYVLITSKIWDIPEQTGQQGGRVVWNHTSKQFTPYPTIVSYDNIVITGNSTVVMPENPGNNQIVNKSYVDTLIATQGGSGRNIGDIFFTSRKDSTLNGAVDCNGNQYNTSDFTGAQSIGALLEAGKIPYISLADYATALAANGSVGVFGWDGAGTVAFRVPKLEDIFIETGDISHIGDYIEAGLPNITGTADVLGQGNKAHKGGNYSGALKSVGTANVYNNYDNTSVNAEHGVAIDASESSPVYKNDVTTVQPQTVRYRAMVQLAGGATDEAVETCTNVLADVAGLKSHEVIAFQAPTADNNYTWYRKYADGWVEQGGISQVTTNGLSATITMPVEMLDTNYTLTVAKWGADTGNVGFNAEPYTTTQFKAGVAYGSNLTRSFSWQVSGMAQ